MYQTIIWMKELNCSETKLTLVFILQMQLDKTPIKHFEFPIILSCYRIINHYFIHYTTYLLLYGDFLTKHQQYNPRPGHTHISFIRISTNSIWNPFSWMIGVILGDIYFISHQQQQYDSWERKPWSTKPYHISQLSHGQSACPYWWLIGRRLNIVKCKTLQITWL